MKRSLAWLLATFLVLFLCGGSKLVSKSKSVSVLPFEDLAGTPETLGMTRRLLAELPVKLYHANPSLVLLSRDQEVMDKILKELTLGATGMVDPAKALAMGKLYSAQYFVKGSIERHGEQYRCLFQVIDNTTGTITPGEATVPSWDMLPERLAEEVLNALGMPPTAVQKASLHTPGLATFAGGYEAEQRGDLATAIAAYQEAIRSEPGFPEAWNNLAGIYRKQGLASQALQAYQKALALAPNQAILHANLANLYFDGNNYSGAEQEYTKALQLDEALPKALYNLACLHALQGHKQQALSALERALHLLPELARSAAQDADLAGLRSEPQFQHLTTR